MGFIHKRTYAGMLSLSLLIAFISGCGGSQSSSQGSAGPGDKTAAANGKTADEYKGGPAELVLFDRNAAITKEEFEKFFVQPVRAKYPDIQLKMVTGKMEDLIASGSTPDLVAASNVVIYEYVDLDYADDLSSMIKQLNIDLNRIDPAVVDEIKRIGKNSKIFGLPFGRNYGAMIYNKDIFDKFAVPYPKETMTWNELIDMGKRLTRMSDGVQYIGVSPVNASTMLSQYSLSNVDSGNAKAILTSEAHQKIFGLLQQLYVIPGFTDKGKFNYGPNDFFKEQRLAVHPFWIAAITTQLRTNKIDFNWDLAAHPVFDDRPTLGMPVDFHMLAVSKTSKKKEAAYRVITTLLSDEVQLALNKSGRLSVLKDDKMQSTFAQDSNLYEGKKLPSIFKVRSAPAPAFTEKRTVISPIIGQIEKDIAIQRVDMNTALRNAEMKANQAIQTK